MSLSLKLRPRERLIINGCVIQNGPRRAEIEVHTYADVLRGDELLDAQTANTPTRQLGYFIQIALVSRKDRAEYLPRIDALVADLRNIFVSDRLECLDRVLTLVGQEDFYRAWRELRPLITYEDALMSDPVT